MTSKQIGKEQQPFTAIATSDAHTITVRGKDLCTELIGKIGFADYFWLLLTGTEPTTDQSFFVNATLVTVAEHGLTVTAQTARMTFAAEPDALQAAVAAGILGAGKVVLGTSELCGMLLSKVVDDAGINGVHMEASAQAALEAIKARKETVPGFGHHLHGEGDPRTIRLLSLAQERGTAGLHVQALRAIERLIPKVFGKTLVANASAAIPAVLLDVGYPPSALKGIPILARTAGLIAHLAEEASRPIGFLMSHHAALSIEYDGE